MATLPHLCAVLVAVLVGASLGLVPTAVAEEPNREGHEQEKGPTLRLLPIPVDFADEDTVLVAGPRQDVPGDSPYSVPWVPSDGTVASARLAARLPISLITDDLLMSVLRGKRGERGRRGRIVRVYDRATRRWYRYFIPSLSMNNVFGQFRPAGTSRRARSGSYRDSARATGHAEPGTSHGQGADTPREEGGRAWLGDAEGGTGPFADHGYY
ncbi:Hypp806 [Branchiostoma lanceolatum]|uniref:Hypp806 protein n=1 Tax=Branchiostoma lanceolatum TaxID=7740 RepID=A0A8J9VBT8_BRALA|nr:Hypp806 [Branchiostoma lanceolatum]